MKKLFFALFAACLLALTGCNNGDPELGGFSFGIENLAD